MNALSLLLTHVLIGCRNACDVGDASRARNDLTLCSAVVHAMDMPDVGATMAIAAAFDAWCNSSGSDATGSQHIRLPMYTEWIASLKQDPLQLEAWNRDPGAALIIKVLHIGQGLASSALGRGDLRRCGIEVDHIHNLPYAGVGDATDRFREYLDGDKPLYLERLRSGYGSAAVEESTAHFHRFWTTMMEM